MKSFGEFIIEADTSTLGKLELTKTSVDKAYDWAVARFEKHDRILDEEFPDFRKNYKLAQKKAGSGKLLRRDMPVIRSFQIREFQTRLMSGFLDIRAPFAPQTDANDPFPKGLSGRAAEKFMSAGLKVHDGSAKDDRIQVAQSKVAAKTLRPLQRQIYADKAIAMMAKTGVQANREFLAHNTFFVLSKDHFIIDGHHRMLTAMLVDPDIKVNSIIIGLPIKKLLPLALAFGDAKGNPRNH